MTALLERLEGAREGSRELDCELAVLLDGYVTKPGWRVTDYCRVRDGETTEPGHGGDQLVPHYTTSIDAALALAERVLPGWQSVMATGQSAKGPPWVQAYPNPAEEDVYQDAATASTLPLALCIALIRATAKEGAGG